MPLSEEARPNLLIMASTTGRYDQNLLASAPVATRAQLQEGYATDLLDSNHGKATPTTPPPASQVDPERGLVPKEYNDSRAQPFWRTGKGRIVIFLVALVVVGAIVGGAVGGTVGKKKHQQEQSQNSGSTQQNPVGTAGSTTRPVQSTVTSVPPSSTTTIPTANSLAIATGVLEGGLQSGR